MNHKVEDNILYINGDNKRPIVTIPDDASDSITGIVVKDATVDTFNLSKFPHIESVWFVNVSMSKRVHKFPSISRLTLQNVSSSDDIRIVAPALEELWLSEGCPIDFRFVEAMKNLKKLEGAPLTEELYPFRKLHKFMKFKGMDTEATLTHLKELPFDFVLPSNKTNHLILDEFGSSLDLSRCSQLRTIDVDYEGGLLENVPEDVTLNISVQGKNLEDLIYALKRIKRVRRIHIVVIDTVDYPYDSIVINTECDELEIETDLWSNYIYDKKFGYVYVNYSNPNPPTLTLYHNANTVEADSLVIMRKGEVGTWESFRPKKLFDNFGEAIGFIPNYTIED